MTLLKALLEKRGITKKDQQDHFLHPDYERDVHDPFLLTDMNTAVDRVARAIEDKERIAIYSDYDMDGIPGAVVLSDFFKSAKYDNVTHYVPNRNSEGFGLNYSALEKLADDNVKLVITVDCGSRAVDEVSYAKKLGLDVIVTDHHVPGEKFPEALAFVNPNRGDDEYPNKHLCGAGVAYKLFSALSTSMDTVQEGSEKWSLDMVAAATVSDMVSLVGENRALVHFGLRVLRKSTRPGIAALCRTARVKQQYITEDDIMFSIAPRINAASRMGHAGDALLLLTASNSETALIQAKHLEKLNKERKAAVATMVRHIKKTVPEEDAKEQVLVVGDPRWQPGLLGLAAQRSVELYGTTVCVWGRGDASVVKGSCRSDGSINIVSLLEDASDVLVDYGGHEYSGGFSVQTEDVHKLAPSFIEHKPAAQGSEESVPVDAALTLDDVDWETYRAIEQLAPFGVGNAKPLFLFERVVVQDARRFGAGNAHLELTFTRTDGVQVRAIRFFAGEEFDEKCAQDMTINLHAHLEQSFFNREPELRLRIVSVI